jgi:6-phosphogluconate dehydrogenase
VDGRRLGCRLRLPVITHSAKISQENYYKLLGICIRRELEKREKLLEYNTVDDVVSLLQKSQRIIVLTGAGVRIPVLCG